MKTLSIFLFILLGLSACKKELVEDLDTELPIYQQTYWASFVASYITKRYTTINHTYYIYPERAYSAHFVQEGNLVEGGKVTADGKVLMFNNSFYQGKWTLIPKPDTAIWEVAGNLTFPSFRYTSTEPVPQLGHIPSANQAVKGSNYYLMSTSNTGADSTRFVLANLQYTKAGSVHSHTFSSEDLEQAPVGQSTASITAFTYEKVKIEGIWMEFRKEATQEIVVEIK